MNGKFSYWIALKKAGRTLLELATAVVISVSPQLLNQLVSLVDEAHEAEAIGIPPGWVVVWLAVVRIASNRLKNRNLGRQ